MNEATHVLLSRGLFVALLPLIFTLLAGFVALRWYRSLIPIVIGMALYVAVCLIRFIPVTVPDEVDLLGLGCDAR